MAAFTRRSAKADAVWRDAMARANAVDMMDNADALTTCPQPKQQTQLLAA